MFVPASQNMGKNDCLMGHYLKYMTLSTGPGHYYWWLICKYEVWRKKLEQQILKYLIIGRYGLQVQIFVMVE